MLFPGRTESDTSANAVVMRPHHKAVDAPYFCPGLSCLSDDLLARQATSFRNVWLVTDVDTDRTWLMQAPQPNCPHCGSQLYPAIDDKMNKQSAIDYAVADFLLTDYSTNAEQCLVG